MIDNAIILTKEEYENVKNNIRNSAYRKGTREFAKFLIDKGIDVVDLHAEFLEGIINND